MNIHVLTLFPEMFHGILGASILGRAHSEGLLEVQLVNFREYATDRHRTVDDYPYGGGAGMVLKPEPIFRAIEAVREQAPSEHTRIILLSPQGRTFDQNIARELAKEEHLIFICGHYEGYDERIREHLVTDEISIGDYVLTGGELPALVVIDAIARLMPGVLGNDQSAMHDSFAEGLLEFPHYTRPFDFRGWKVPDILASGHHGQIAAWRRQQSLLRTLKRRPELLDEAKLVAEDQRFLDLLIKSD